MNYEESELQDLESSIQLWLLSDEHDFENQFGEDFTAAVREELGYE